jgi:hypothetical protein
MVSVGGRDVCWWRWSVIVAAFELGGEAGRKGWEEGMGGNREGDVAVRSTDHRRGDPPSFLLLTRGDTTSLSATRRVD